MSLKRFEIILLVMLALVLPSLEVPKTLFWASYVIVFLIRNQREGVLHLWPQSPVMLAVWGILIVNMASSLVNWPIEYRFKGIFDALRYTSLFLCIYAGGYKVRDLRLIAVAIIVGAVLGLFYGMAELYNNDVTRLQFHSAGVVTQSAIYLGMVISLAVGFVFQGSDFPRLARFGLILLIAFMGAALAYMGSRGSILAMLAVLGVFVISDLRRRVVIYTLGGTLLLAIASYILIEVVSKYVPSDGQYEQFSVERFQQADSERIEAWRTAIAQISTGNDLLLGIGPRNFGTINPEDLGIKSLFYERSGVIHHAHNLFLTTMVETGLLGLSALLVFFILVLMKLARIWREQSQDGPGWAWYAGLGGLMMPIIAGSFNTPFIQEHAMLAMMLIAMMYASDQKLQPSNSMA